MAARHKIKPTLPNLRDFSLYVMREDDERFKLKAGDIFIGQTYQHDPGKVSVGFRIRDGFDPGCNQYRSSVRKLTDEEAEFAVWRRKLPPASTP